MQFRAMVMIVLGQVLCSLSCAYAKDMSFGFVDTMKIIETSEMGKSASTAFEAFRSAKQAEAERKQKAFQAEVESYKKTKDMLKPQAREKKEAHLQEEQFKLQQYAQQAHMEMQAKQAELTKPIFNKVRKISADIAEKKKLNLILDRNEAFVLFSKDGDDYTKEVLQILDKEAKEAAATKTAAAS